MFKENDSKHEAAGSNQADLSLDFRFDAQPTRSSLKSQNGFLNITHKLHPATTTPALHTATVINAIPQSSTSATLNFPLVQNKIDDLNE